MSKLHIRIVDRISALGLGNGVIEFPNCLLRDASFEALSLAIPVSDLVLDLLKVQLMSYDFSPYDRVDGFLTGVGNHCFKFLDFGLGSLAALSQVLPFFLLLFVHGALERDYAG